MISRVSEKRTTEQVLSLMHPVVSEWFKAKFGGVTEAQAMAVPLIHAKKNVLVSSPTGSGKTLTAFLSILNELILLAGEGRLEDRIYAVYVSPLKALANDINENLLRPLAEISELFEAKGLIPPDIKVAVRTGDTLASERQKQARSPPHVFITTPESLSLVLSTPVFSTKFVGVDYVIVDEVHEICDSKRGVALALALERLQSFCSKEFVRIGLSATVAPLDQVGEYLVGVKDGKSRDVSVVEVYRQRDLDLRVLCPTKDMTALSFEVVNSKMYDMLKGMIDEHRTTLVFTNTRSGAESVVYKLKERGLEKVGTHHGSLSRETRMDVEGSLREGLLQAVVSSTSLELGIDIGSIDLVVQIGSPKSVAKGLQRVGRAGHQYGGTSKGRIVVFESDDLVECAVLCRAAHRKMIDRVTIPMNSLDVLAQTLVGMSIEKRWKVDEALALVRRAYCYKDLKESDFLSVMRYLGGKDDFEGIYSKLWYDEKEGTFGKKRGSRMIYYLNQGTIPEESDYTVYSERGSPVGSLSEKFVERLSSGDIFVLGGRSYEFLKSKGTKVFVRSASGRKPTVPSWTGEMLPRSFDLSVAIGRFRSEMETRLGRSAEAEIVHWLKDEFDVDDGSATTILNYFKEQRVVAKIPTDERLIIEGYVDASGNKSAIFHFPFGRRVNDALSRAYASILSSRLKSNVTVSVTDDSFMLTAPRSFRLEDIGGMLGASDLERVLRNAVRGSELFNQRFRHTATRSFMVLRNYKGKELSVARQQLRSSRLLDALHEIEDFPVMSETYVEILTEVMDLEHAQEVLASIESGARQVEYLPFSGVPSPFAHNVILVGVSDIVLMEDRSMLLRELHRKVLARVLGEEAVSEYQFDTDEVEEYFAAKFPRIESKQDILEALGLVGPMSLFREKGESIFSHSSQPFDRLRTWASELLREGKVRSVWITEDAYVRAEDHPLYVSLHRRQPPLEKAEESILNALEDEGGQSQQELMESLKLSREEVRESVRRLELWNQIYRSELRGETYHYSVAPREERPRRKCLEEAVVSHVAYHAPITVEDVAYEVGISEQEAEEALRELAMSEVVVSGRFVVGEQLQYMLARDYLRLKSGGEPVYDRETVRAFSEAKQFSKVSSVREFFEKFGEAGMIYDIFQRVEQFDMEEFGELRKKGEILLGRFVRGRLRYVLSEDAPYYLGVYRKDKLDKYEAEIYRALEKMGSGTYQEIAEASGLPQDIVREHFDTLDRKGLLLRQYDEAESWSSRNVYALCEIEPEQGDPYSRIVKRYLRGYGPVTAMQAASYLDVEPDEARSLLLKVGAKVITVGLERTEMYLLPEEVRELDRPQVQDEKLRILSLYDSFLSDKWTEITSRFGEGWFFPVVKNGKVVGMIEKWLLAGSVEVREIFLDSSEHLGQLIEAFDDMMPFYNALGVEILRVTRVLGSDVTDLREEVKEEFIRRGFAESNGMLVKGNLTLPCFEQEDLLAVTFSMQNLQEGAKLRGMDEALQAYGGLRSNAEALLRVQKFESLARMHKRGAVIRGHLIPDRIGYCRMEEASLYRSARAAETTADEKLVLRIIKDQQPVKRDRLLDLSPLGRTDTMDAAKSLYQASRAYFDSTLSYVGTRRQNTSRDSAWARVVKRLFENYGVMNAESLSTLLGHEVSMRELRKVLRRLEREGFLVKGFMLKGSGTLFWASGEAFSRLGKAEFSGEVILSPEDNLTQFLRAAYRDVLPETGRHAIFRGVHTIGSFHGKVREGRLEVSDLSGVPECEEIISKYAKLLGLAVQEREEGRLSDWEITEFYHKTHPGAAR
ncbi:MAG: ATP-dependent helicase [Thermoplasmata archaeon]|nr:ATP-dependent helicase [Thermoplasmata archaeon]